MERLRLRRTPAPLKLAKESSEEPRLHHRPLSLTDEQVPMDALEVLLDAMPSRSLPATPLAKKRSETVNYSPPVSPMFAEPTSPASNTVSVPVEINSSSGSLDVKNEDAMIMNSNEESLVNVDTQHVEEPTGTEMDVPFTGYIVAKESQKDPDPSQESLSSFKELTWNEIREILKVSDQTQCNILPNEDQEWTKHSSGIEQLRAFLAVCD